MEDSNAGNVNAEHDETHTVEYWKQRALHMEKLLEASLQREQVLVENLAELTQNSNIDDNFLHSILENSPVVIGHQDKDLRYRYIYNHFPSLQDEDIIGKTDLEISKGGGIKECEEFKKEVLERGLPAKREITYETELFGAKDVLDVRRTCFQQCRREEWNKLCGNGNNRSSKKARKDGKASRRDSCAKS